MWFWTVILFSVREITPEVFPKAICQLSDCRYAARPNCSLQHLAISKARPVQPVSINQALIPRDHLFNLFYDPDVDGQPCMFLSLELTAYSSTESSRYVLYLTVGHDRDPGNGLTHKFETPENFTTADEEKDGCFERATIFSCVSHVFEQFRLTVYEDEQSFALEDGSPTAPPGTRMIFRKEVAERQDNECSRDRYGNFWRNLDWTRRCIRRRSVFGKGDESLTVTTAVQGSDLSFGVTIGILLILWLIWLLAIGLRKFYIAFIVK